MVQLLVLACYPKSTSVTKIRELIKLHEGLRLEAYKDSLGYWTIGFGHLLPARTDWAGYTINESTAYTLLDFDMAEHLPPSWAQPLDEVRYAVIWDMCFNLGVEPFDGDGFKDWPIFIEQVTSGLYEKAAANMRSTKWAKQVGKRAERLATMMESGKWPPEVS